MTASREGDHERAETLLTRALRLWRGRPLESLAITAPMEAEVHFLTELQLMLWEEYAGLLLETGRYHEAVPELTRLTLAHPHRERFSYQLMLALALGGDRSGALNTYRRCYHLLVDELGIEPCRELSELHDSVLTDSVSAPGRPSGRVGRVPFLSSAH